MPAKFEGGRRTIIISRHVECEPHNDDYRRLANYIADASHDGEKTLMSWCAGCWSDEDEYPLAIQEVADTQALNHRTTKEKTYHLLIVRFSLIKPQLCWW